METAVTAGGPTAAVTIELAANQATWPTSFLDPTARRRFWVCLVFLTTSLDIGMTAPMMVTASMVLGRRLCTRCTVRKMIFRRLLAAQRVTFDSEALWLSTRSVFCIILLKLYSFALHATVVLDTFPRNVPYCIRPCKKWSTMAHRETAIAWSWHILLQHNPCLLTFQPSDRLCLCIFQTFLPPAKYRDRHTYMQHCPSAICRMGRRDRRGETSRSPPLLDGV